MTRHQILASVIGLGLAALVTSWLPVVAPRSPLRHASWLVLAGITALIVYVTLRTTGGLAAADCFLPDDLDARVLDVGQNIVLFLPFGAALAAACLERGVRWSRTIGVGGVVGVLLSTTVELVQRDLPSRCASPIDVVTNGLGAVVGAAVVVVVVTAIRRWR